MNNICPICEKPEPCICGRKKGHYRCSICDSDVPELNAVWAAAGIPLHADCFAAWRAGAGLDTTEPEMPRPEARDTPYYIQIPLNFTITIPISAENFEHEIKYAVEHFLTNVIMAYRVAKVEFDPKTQQLRFSDLNEILNKILASWEEQERNKRDREKGKEKQ